MRAADIAELQFCIVEKRDDHLQIVTLNRPERLNALHSPASEELGEVFDGMTFRWDLTKPVIAMKNSEDFIEGPKAFSEKRPPKWQGK